MKKRLFTLCVFLYSLIILQPINASAATGTLAKLAALTAGTSQAGDALEKFVRAIDTAYNTITHIADDISERRDKRELQELNRAVTKLFSFQQDFLRTIDNYIKNPSNEDWQYIMMRTDNLITSVDDLLSRLDKDRTGLVSGTPDGYMELLETAHTRAGKLRELKRIEQPKTLEELRELKSFRNQYVRLVNNLKSASFKLSAYIEKRYSKTKS